MFQKMKRRELTLLVIILALCIALPIWAVATIDADVTVGSTETAVHPGDSITIPVSIADNPGIACYALTISYDSTNLTLKSISNADSLCNYGLFMAPAIETPGTASVTWVDPNGNLTANGNLFYLNFTVNENAAAGNCAVTCALTEGKPSSFTNYAEESIAVTFHEGNIEVVLPDTTAPEMTKLTATIGGTDSESNDGTLSCTVGDTVTSIKAAMSEPVSFVDGASTNVTMSGGSIPENTVYGTLALDASDETNQTVIITPIAGNETAGLEGTFTFTVAADTLQDASGNGNEEANFTLTVAAADTTDPTLTSVEPAAGAVELSADEDFVLTVTADDNTALAELEIDHNMEASLPEFSVYADSENPYGSAEDQAAFEEAGVSVTYGDGVWTIDFGDTVTDAIINNGGITFYMVIKDTSGNSWGSMYEVTDDNTFAYTVTRKALNDLVWDGSIDTSWYTTTGTEFTLTTAAQFAGLAAIVNNKPATSAAGVVTGTDPAIPADDFLDKTVRLAVDLDLGGVEDVAGGLSVTAWTAPVWSGQMWTPIGSNTGSSESSNGTIGRPFKGTFDGQFHSISNIYIPFGGESHALFGELGHDGVVKSIIIKSGYICGNRYTAGIAGRNWGYVANCANYATVDTDGDRSGGGITGVNYENTPGDALRPTVINCYNAGTIMKGDRRWSGGITGDNEGIIQNCYNIGTGRFKPFGDLMGGILGGGHSNSGPLINCYSLSGDGQPTAIIAANGSIPAGCALKTDAELKATTFGENDILTLLGGAFVADTTNINNGYPVLFGQRGLTMSTITVDTGIENGGISVPAEVTEGNTVIVTVTPSEGYHLLADSLTYTVAGEDPVAITATDGVYSFVMPAADVTITAAFTDILWGGSGTQADPYKITDAAGLKAVADYTNAGNTTKGLYWELANDIDLSTVCSETLGSWTPIGNYVLPAPSFGYSYPAASGYAFLGDFNGNGHKIENLYVSSDASNLGLFGTVGGTDTPGAAGYGKVHNFRLYGTVINTVTEIAWQNSDTYVDFVGAVCGLLNAGGTISDIINYATVEAPNASEVGGIVGFAGTPVMWGNMNAGVGSGAKNYTNYTSNPSGYNTFILRCGNEAEIHGYYKEGGIVGENAATVMYCYNNGYINPHMHGSGGGWGGIAGRNGNNDTACEESVIAYCYNTAKITNNGMNDDENETIKGFAGISGKTYGGKGHNTLYNCYNIGEIPAGRDDGAAYGSITTNLEFSNKDEVVYNNYSLDTPLIHNNGGSGGVQYIWETGIIIPEQVFKTTTYGDSDILTQLGVNFMADTTNINNGYPILRWQVGAELPSLVSISINTPPTKMTYDATEVFDPAGMVMIGSYTDGSKAVISDYSYSTDPLAEGTTSIDITYGGFTLTQPITVNSLSLTDLAITTNPNNMIYAADETFDRTGMVVTATYNENAATNAEIAYDATGAAGYTYSVDEIGLLTVSYTEGDVTKTATLQLTKLDSNAPTAVNGVYQLQNANDMIWFANQVNEVGNTTMNVELTGGIDLGEVDWTPIGTYYKPYCGEFNGNNNTITFNNTFTNSTGYYAGIFGYVGTSTVDTVVYTANIHDLTTAGQITTTGYFSAVGGMVAYAATGTFTNCVNQATINATASAGGIAGYAYTGSSFTNCANEGVITTTSSYSGGIAGYTSGATFTNCANSADIKGSSYAAGIAGKAADISNVSNCTNSGDISGSGSIAGICGDISGTANIQYCSNRGNITGTSTTIAGIAGTGYGTIDNCYNTGAIQGTYYVGGIVGKNISAAVTNCYNTANIKGTAGNSVYQASGGIAGVGGMGSFTNCYNSGAVSAKNAGALVGASNNSIFTLNNCYYVTDTASVAYNERTAGNVVANNVSAVTATELKALATTLGAAYKTGTISPIFTWQPDEIFSSNMPVANNGTVTAEVPSTLVIGANSNVGIDATLVTGDAITKAKVYLPNTVVEQLDDAQSLTVETNMGTVTFDAEALDDIADNADGSLVLTLDLTSDNEGITVYDLTLQDYAGNDVFTEGSATVTLPYTLAEGQSPDAVKVFYVAGNGTKVEVKCSYANGYVTFTVKHFSTYSIEADGTAISAVSATTDVNAGETFDVAVKVYGTEGQQFASMSADLSYDDTQVEYVGFTAGEGTTDASAYDNKTTNKINILESGANKTIGTDGFTIGTVTFKALTGIAAGNSVASFAISDGTVGQSGTPTPAISAVSGADLAVNLHNLTVTFQQGTGNTMTTATAYAKYNEAGLYASNDYTDAFTIPEPIAAAGYRLADKVWNDGSTSYTAAEVAALTFADNATMTAQSVKVYDVSFYDSDATQIGSNQTVDTGLSATAPADPTAPAGMSFAGWFIATTADASYDGSATLYSKAAIDAAAVTADTIYKAYYTDNEYSITAPAEISFVSGVTAGMAKHGTDVVFTANLDASGIYTYVVSYKVGTADAVILAADTNSQYTIPGAAITDAVVVSILKTVNGSVSYITYDEYKGAPVDYKVALLTLNSDAPEGCKYQYDGEDMFYAQPVNTEAPYGTGAYVFFVAADEDVLTTLSKIEIVSGTQPTIDYDGNVNDLSGVEINDAQMVYDLYNNDTYQSDFNFATMLMRFEADVNGDGTIGVNDIRMIYSIIRGITE